MPGKVFISCGQRPPKETKTAKKIKELLKKFDLNSYLAFKVQSFDDIMKITQELSKSDYYLFVDFRREKIGRKKYRGSLFTHQELALARHLGFSEMIALREEGVVSEGFAAYILSIPDEFKDEKELLEKIEKLVEDRKWSSSYSRNLIIKDIQRIREPFIYENLRQYAWVCTIENRRNDKAAINTLAVFKKYRISKWSKWAT